MERKHGTYAGDSFDGAPSGMTERQPLEVLHSDASPTADPLEDEELEAQLALQNLKKRRARKKRMRIIRIGILLAVIGGILAFTLGRKMLTPEQPDEEYVPETAIVERRDFQNIISSSGALRAGSTVVVTPEVDGTIESVLVTEGQSVEKGELLFTIKNDSLDKAVRDAGQEVQAANQAVASAQRGVTDAQQSRDDAWNRYNREWDDADAQHKDWAYLSKNYDRLHREWEKRQSEADSLACGAPQDPGAEPTMPDEPAEPKREDFETEAEYQTAMNTYKKDLATYDAKKAAHDKWQQLYDQFLSDTETFKAYQDALARVGEEPQPAGAEPVYPEAPDDTALLSAIESAQEGVTSALQGVEKAQEAYDEAVELAGKRQVKAPSAGNIVALGAKVGEAVGGSSSEGSSGPLVQISDVKQMSVNIEVNEIDILNVKKGQRATATFSAVSGVEVEAKVSEVATIATGGGEGGGIVTFHVGLVIPKPDPKLREGMTANVKIYTVDIKDALVVPTSALFEGSDGMTVEVVTDQETLETEIRPVKVGARSASEAVIEEGLEEGETVLLTGGLMDSYDSYGYYDMGY